MTNYLTAAESLDILCEEPNLIDTTINAGSRLAVGSVILGSYSLVCFAGYSLSKATFPDAVYQLSDIVGFGFAAALTGAVVVFGSGLAAAGIREISNGATELVRVLESSCQRKVYMRNSRFRHPSRFDRLFGSEIIPVESIEGLDRLAKDTHYFMNGIIIEGADKMPESNTLIRVSLHGTDFVISDGSRLNEGLERKPKGSAVYLTGKKWQFEDNVLFTHLEQTGKALVNKK